MAVAVTGAATIVGLVWKRRQGRWYGVGTGGAAASLLLFTTPTCSSCRRVRELCAGLDGVGFREVDASTDPAEARAHDVRRAPTLLVLDRAGTVLWRSTGVPDRAELEALVRAA